MLGHLNAGKPAARNGPASLLNFAVFWRPVWARPRLRSGCGVRNFRSLTGHQLMERCLAVMG